MALLGTVSIVVIGLLGRRLGGSRVGLIAAGLAAIYPNIWINDGMLLTETVFILATATALLATYLYLVSHWCSPDEGCPVATASFNCWSPPSFLPCAWRRGSRTTSRASMSPCC